MTMLSSIGSPRGAPMHTIVHENSRVHKTRVEELIFKLKLDILEFIVKNKNKVSRSLFGKVLTLGEQTFFISYLECTYILFTVKTATI